ncbi:MAG: hypothetical protein JWP89_2769 [Schlesneria sp.]|nr:hypothetical protein [Schlesneria sp.]
MDQVPSVCPKCQGEMIQGHALDCTYGGVLVSSWQEGPPKKAFWGGLKIPRRHSLLPLGAYRCQTCGYLEFYAREEFAPT